MIDRPHHYIGQDGDERYLQPRANLSEEYSACTPIPQANDAMVVNAPASVSCQQHSTGGGGTKERAARGGYMCRLRDKSILSINDVANNEDLKKMSWSMRPFHTNLRKKRYQVIPVADAFIHPREPKDGTTEHVSAASAPTNQPLSVTPTPRPTGVRGGEIGRNKTSPGKNNLPVIPTITHLPPVPDVLAPGRPPVGLGIPSWTPLNRGSAGSASFRSNGGILCDDRAGKVIRGKNSGRRQQQQVLSRAEHAALPSSAESFARKFARFHERHTRDDGHKPDRDAWGKQPSHQFLLVRSRMSRDCHKYPEGVDANHAARSRLYGQVLGEVGGFSKPQATDRSSNRWARGNRRTVESTSPRHVERKHQALREVQSCWSAWSRDIGGDGDGAVKELIPEKEEEILTEIFRNLDGRGRGEVRLDEALFHMTENAQVWNQILYGERQ